MGTGQWEGSSAYLAAKSVLDERAVNREVEREAAAAIRRLAGERDAAAPLRALEVGAGAGHGFQRWLALAAAFDEAVEFTVTDPSAALLAAHRDAVAAWAGERRYPTASEEGGRRLRIEWEGRRLTVRFAEATLPADLDRLPTGAFDLLVAQSVWDLTPPGTALRAATRLLRPGGILYSVLTFCGETEFEPPLPLDQAVLDRYHRSIAERGGDPRAGIRLASDLERAAADFAVLASGRSDWRAPADAEHPSDEERVFLPAVLGFIEKEVAGIEKEVAEHSEIPESADWLAARRRALAAGRLRFRAANRDIAARRR